MSSQNSLFSILKEPSAWLPIIMSTAALVLLLAYVVRFGIQEPQADEGTAAHIFQLLMGTQALIVAFFAVKWIPQAPKQAVQILALQILAALIPFALLFFFEM